MMRLLSWSLDEWWTSEEAAGESLKAVERQHFIVWTENVIM